MTPARAPLLLLTAIVPLAVAACDTVKKPIRGYDKQPPGTILLDDAAGGTVMMWPMFDLPQTEDIFRPRLDGQDVVYKLTYQQGFEVYDYSSWPLQGWTGGWNNSMAAIEPGTHVVEIVDSAGQSWGQSAPLAIPAGGDPSTPPSGQFPAVVFAHFDGKVAAWNIDPATQDADTATDEITVTNLVDADVVVERCQISSGRSSSCTSVGTVAPGADLLTVERVAGVASTDDHQALVIHLASDASQSYQRDLLPGGGSFQFGSTCQMERIVVHGTRQVVYAAGGTAFAMSSCYGYQSGPIRQD
jgi:hypothetical protein